MHPTHQTILSLARAGNPVRAWALFQSSGLAAQEDDPKVLTLKGRLLKDLARRAEGDERSRLYSQASDAYMAANALGEDSYPLINAAALACFAGDDARAGRIASRVLTLIDNDPNEGETAYWREATRAEAHLLLRQMDQATAALALAYKKLPFAHEDQAATLGQFDRILEAQGEDPSWLEPFRVPCSVNFVSDIDNDFSADQMTRVIEQSLDQLTPGYGFGTIRDVPDLLFAERLLESGAELSLVFARDPEAICSSVFAPRASQWEHRFRSVLAKAVQIEVLPLVLAHPPIPENITNEIVQLVTVGQSLRRSEALRSRAHSIVVSRRNEQAPLRVEFLNTQSMPRFGAKPSFTNASEATQHGTASLTMLKGLVSVKEAEAILGIPQAQKLKAVETADGRLYQGSLHDALDAAVAIAAQAQTSVSLHLGHPNGRAVWESLSDRMARFARAEHAAHLKMGLQSAMIAKVLRPSLRIEELGEIQTYSGHASIWSAME
ncbi:MAG: tetratricopeptide repeat-containing protein [Erythrobacter sp.]|uniref:tetratricopeptide repeat-containing protein n=1 Tax=Erythrobacter sp. TaxID=1042 RepID=UPI0032979852